MGTVRYTVFDGEIVSETRDGVKRDYVPDPLGSTVALLDSNQAKTDSFDYWPYGQERVRTGGCASPFRYVGTIGYCSDTMAQVYVRNRYLTLGTGRWLSPDPIAQQVRRGRSAFMYGSSSPTTRVDSTGLFVFQGCSLADAHWLSRDRKFPEPPYGYASNQPAIAADPSGNYVVLVRGGPGRPTTMTPLANWIASTWNESVLQPLYAWTIGGDLPRPTPPNAEIVLQVLGQIYSWLATSPPSSDKCNLWLYGHSWGAHVVGQIAAASDRRIHQMKTMIEDDFGVQFKRYVTSVGWARNYPAHFTAVHKILYCLPGDKKLQERGWPREIVWWWNPTNYNTRNLEPPAAWHSGGKDVVIQGPETPPAPAPPHYFTHKSFDARQELCEIPKWQRIMFDFITQHLLADHPGRGP